MQDSSAPPSHPTAPIPYDATAKRPAWLELPAPVRAEIEGRLGTPVAAATSAGGGFTAGFAARIVTADGRRAFVKAESVDRNLMIAECYRREAVVNAALPPGVPAPRLRWSAEVDGWVVLCFDDVDGRMPSWRDGDLDAVLTLASRLTEELDPPPAGLALTSFVDDAARDLMVWRRMAGGELGVATVDPWWASRVELLASLEAGWEEACAGTAMIHCDLRPDNLLIDCAGKAWLCDWNWPCLAAPWIDLAVMLPTVHHAGLDASAVLAAHPVGRHAEPEAVNAVLAAFAGMFFEWSSAPPPEQASPWLRVHQRRYGAITLAWLRSRLQT
jgi:hypothetical protein